MNREKTYEQALEEGRGRLAQANISDAELDAWYLLSFVFDFSRSEYYLCSQDEIVDKKKLLLYEDFITQRAEHIPLQHILGTQEFMGLTFKVSPSVLIPRSETELLVERAEAFARESDKEVPLRLLDLCTGTGCIAISLKKRNPKLKVTAVDISQNALSIARSNAEVLETEIDFRLGDLFAPVGGTFDIITVNPPYIPSADIDALEEEVRDHEPITALDGGEDGLHFYRRLANEAPQYLASGGYLLMEIGYNQGEEICELLEKKGEYEEISIEKDLAGLNRMVISRKK